MPIKRATAASPRRVKNRIRNVDENSTMKVADQAISAAPRRSKVPGTSPDENTSSTANSDGPAINGIASGTRSGSPSRSFSAAGSRPGKTILNPMMNKMMPPAMATDSDRSPKNPMTKRPQKTNPTITARANRSSRVKTRRCLVGGTRSRIVKKTGMFPKGSMIRNKVTDIETISIQRQASSSVIKCVREAITRREDGQYGIWDDDPMPVFPNFSLRLTRHYAREVHLNMKGFNIMVELDFSKTNGLIPAIAQDYKSGKVLMLAYINEASWKKTLETGEVHYWSRSRSELWHKGGTSGHVQKVKEILVDCDDDTVLFKVEQVGGAACHKGYESCFYRRVEEDGTLKRIAEKVFDPEKVYKK